MTVIKTIAVDSFPSTNVTLVPVPGLQLPVKAGTASPHRSVDHLLLTPEAEEETASLPAGLAGSAVATTGFA